MDNCLVFNTITSRPKVLKNEKTGRNEAAVGIDRLHICGKLCLGHARYRISLAKKATCPLGVNELT